MDYIAYLNNKSNKKTISMSILWYLTLPWSEQSTQSELKTLLIDSDIVVTHILWKRFMNMMIDNFNDIRYDAYRLRHIELLKCMICSYRIRIINDINILNIIYDAVYDEVMRHSNYYYILDVIIDNLINMHLCDKGNYTTTEPITLGGMYYKVSNISNWRS